MYISFPGTTFANYNRGCYSKDNVLFRANDRSYDFESPMYTDTLTLDNVDRDAVLRYLPDSSTYVIVSLIHNIKTAI